MSDLGEIYLTLVPAPDEGDTLGEACQQALRDFYHVLRASRMKVMPRILGQGSVGAADSLTGERGGVKNSDSSLSGKAGA
jgi:hypothetical protein